MISDPDFMSIKERIRLLRMTREVLVELDRLQKEGLSKDEMGIGLRLVLENATTGKPSYLAYQLRARFWQLMLENATTGEDQSEDPKPNPFPA